MDPSTLRDAEAKAYRAGYAAALKAMAGALRKLHPGSSNSLFSAGGIGTLLYPDQNPGMVPIEELDLRPAICKILRNNGIYSLADLANCTFSQLMGFNGLTSHGLRQIRLKLRDFGMMLKVDRTADVSQPQQPETAPDTAGMAIHQAREAGLLSGASIKHQAAPGTGA